MSRPRKPERIHAFAVALTRVAEADHRLRAAAAEHVGLSLADFDAVRYLADAGSGSGRADRRGDGDHRGAVTGLVDRLERAGWVERARHGTRSAPGRRAAGGGAARADRCRPRAARPAARTRRSPSSTTPRCTRPRRCLDDAAEQLLAGAAELARDRPRPATAPKRAPPRAMHRAPIGGDRARPAAVRRRGGARLALRGARIKDLYRASFDGKRPQVTVEPSGEVDDSVQGVLVVRHARGRGAADADDGGAMVDRNSPRRLAPRRRSGRAAVSSDRDHRRRERVGLTLPRPRGRRRCGCRAARAAW